MKTLYKHIVKFMKIIHFKSFLMSIKIIKNIMHISKLVFIKWVETCKIQNNLTHFTCVILENYVKNK